MAIIRFDLFDSRSAYNAAAGKTLETAEAAARARCEADDGAWQGSSTDGNGLTIFTWHTHVGLCVADREMNGYDDSDWYMTVYEPATDSFREIMFATTRGWSYPSYGSRPDATPEVIAKWKAYQEARAESWRKEKAAREAARPARGKTLKVVSGRKVPVGTVGTCIWIGESRFGVRVGIKDASETVHWTAITNVEVVAA
jgi:hypothetical protein